MRAARLPGLSAVGSLDFNERSDRHHDVDCGLHFGAGTRLDHRCVLSMASKSKLTREITLCLPARPLIERLISAHLRGNSRRRNVLRPVDHSNTNATPRNDYRFNLNARVGLHYVRLAVLFGGMLGVDALEVNRARATLELFVADVFASLPRKDQLPGNAGRWRRRNSRRGW